MLDMATPSGSTRRRQPAFILRAAREAVGLRQDQLAVLLDCRAATISERENSDQGVQWKVWLATAQALGLPADWEPPQEGGG